ncbi:MAG: hypothetical protein ABIG93_02520 [archaeon]|nr:hypothetical protein [Nanoarchaeota archaeon]
MEFSKTELRVLEQVGKGIKKILNIAVALNISNSQVYRNVQKLTQKTIITLVRANIELNMKTHINFLIQLLTKYPELINPFSGTGLQIYTSITNPKTIRDLEKETKFHRTTIFKKLNEGLKLNLVFKKKQQYEINDKIWPEAKEFLIEFKNYDESVDSRIPVNSQIYYKNKKEIVFSSREKLDAEITAFSAYEKFGIKIHTITNYYYLPKTALSRKDIFIHSLHVIEKDPDTRLIIFIALFYLKFKRELSKIKHPIIEKIEKILKGEKIDRFPTLVEIKEKAEIYNIKV